MIFKSFKQFKDHYYPQTEKEKISKMTPEEFGKYLANKSIQIIKDSLKDNKSA